MHPPPPSSIHLHPAPSTSTQFISTSTQLHPSPPSSLQHPQQYLKQNYARNWAISPNLGQIIKKCSFWLKIGIHGILEVFIPNPDLDFWNIDSKIYFWVNLGPKIQSWPFCLKIVARSISRMIPNLDLDFRNFDSKIRWGQIWAQKFKVVRFVWNLVHMVSQGCWFLFQH